MTTQIIKAISLHQPWATLITMGLKKYETRSWSTNYRGQLLICAAKKTSTYQQLTYYYFLTKYQQILTETDNYVDWDDLPFGCSIALVNLTDCIRMTPALISEQSEAEIDSGDWREGRFAWKLDNIRRIVPAIPITDTVGETLLNIKTPIYRVIHGKD